MKYWTCYWNKKTWDEWRKSSGSGKIDYVASSKFNSVDQQSGDVIFVITMQGSKIYLGGRLVVSEFTNDKQVVASRLGFKESLVYSANASIAENYLIGDTKKIQRFESVRIPEAQVDEICFLRKSGVKGPVKRNRDGKIDPNSLITPLQIAPGSEMICNELLDSRASL